MSFPKYVERVDTLMTYDDCIEVDNFLEVYQGHLITVTFKGKEKRQVTFAVSKGFIFNGASIPVALRPIIGNPRDEKLIVPSCIHDYLYAVGAEIGGLLSYQAIADEIFYLLLRREKVNPIKASLFVMGVKTFGFLFKNGKEEAALSKLIFDKLEDK